MMNFDLILKVNYRQRLILTNQPNEITLSKSWQLFLAAFVPFCHIYWRQLNKTKTIFGNSTTQWFDNFERVLFVHTELMHPTLIQNVHNLSMICLPIYPRRRTHIAKLKSEIIFFESDQYCFSLFAH